MDLYLDTNIILDFIWDRKSGFKPLGEFAHFFLSECIACKHNLYISTHTINELSGYLDKNSIQDFIQLIENKVTLLNVLKEDKVCARKSCHHFADALHLCIAKRNKLDKIVTRNLSDFPEEFSILPENV